jgi:hypothetical protein
MGISFSAFFGLFLFSIPRVHALEAFSPESPSLISIPQYINNFYLFALIIAGILALLTLIAGGVLFITSGAVDTKNNGKQLMAGALWGLALVVGAFVILKTINPRLVELDNPGGELQRAYVQGCSEMTELPECKKDDKGKYTETERGTDGECQCRMIAQKSKDAGNNIEFIQEP